MTRTLILIAAFLTLSVPAALAVPPADTGKPENPGNSAAAPGQSEEPMAEPVSELTDDDIPF